MRGDVPRWWAYLKNGMLDLGLAQLEQSAVFAPGNTLYLAQLGEAYALVGQAREGSGRATTTG